jgi:transposase
VAAGRAVCVQALLDAIQVTHSRERELEAEIVERLEVHADQHVFTSLPKAGRGVRAAALLTEIGNARQRFPDEETLAALAGVAPVTRASGKYRVVGFRWACDKKLRNALVDFADDSRHASPWAAKVYADALARTRRHPHAVRILARAWIRVIWRCWQDGVAYDPAKHRGAVRLLAA